MISISEVQSIPWVTANIPQEVTQFTHTPECSKCNSDEINYVYVLEGREVDQFGNPTPSQFDEQGNPVRQNVHPVPGGMELLMLQCARCNYGWAMECATTTSDDLGDPLPPDPDEDDSLIVLDLKKFPRKDR